MTNAVSGPYRSEPIPSIMPYVRGLFALRHDGPDIPLGYVGIPDGLGAQVSVHEAVATANLLAAAPAMRDALALALERVEMNNYGGEEDASIAEIKAALALAGGDTVAGTAAGPDWRAIAAALLPYAESRAEDMLEACGELDGCDPDDATRKAVAAVDAAKALLASLEG